MISAQRLKANRTNARASTGPKTWQGKFRSAQNAWRHGLSLAAGTNPMYRAEVRNLATEIAGQGAAPEIIELARCVAEAQIDVMRVRQARYKLLASKLDNPLYASKASLKGVQKEMAYA